MIELIKEKPFVGLIITLVFGLAVGLILSFTLLSSNDAKEINSLGSLIMLATGHSAISAVNSEQRAVSYTHLRAHETYRNVVFPAVL